MYSRIYLFVAACILVVAGATRYNISVPGICDGLALPDDEERRVIRVDGHATLTLLDTIVAYYQVFAPGLHLIPYTVFDNCNKCRHLWPDERRSRYGSCTLMRCDNYWNAYVIIRHGRISDDLSDSIEECRDYMVVTWTEREMRANWREDTMGYWNLYLDGNDKADTPSLANAV